MLITLPLVILGWLGARAVSQERQAVDQQYKDLLTTQMQQYDTGFQTMLLAWQQQWEIAPWDIDDPDSIREHLNKDGRITQFFCVDDRGDLIYPTSNEETTDRERDFLVRTKPVWSSGAIHPQQLLDSDFQIPMRGTSGKGVSLASKPQGQWYEWYWGDGLQLMYWWPSDSGMIYGVEVNRVRLLSDIIGEIPPLPHRKIKARNVMKFQLKNASSHLIYEWGYFNINTNTPTAVLPLNAPLGSWSLEVYRGSNRDSMMAEEWIMGVSLTSLALILLLLAIYFYRENTRELREAAQRVNFVNHVSHELKTPLTNIRMYAELLQENTQTENEQEKHRLSVILSESQRLSRLIANVLTFNRKQKCTLSIHPKPTNVDNLIQHVLAHFDASFEQHGIQLDLNLNASNEVNIDPDILEQILGNLLSNVEKYARSGDTLSITSTLYTNHIKISVHDNGLGIPPTEAKAIFEPFHRIRNDLTEGVAGTGIGLSIARDLAQLHGGDLKLDPSKTGAHFTLTLSIQGDPS